MIIDSHMQYIAIMDAFIDGGLGEVRMGGQRSSNLKKYENKGDYKDFRIGSLEEDNNRPKFTKYKFLAWC